MKNAYISHVLEEYISGGNFDAVFGDDWIDEAQLAALVPVVCDYAFAEYGIDANAKYADQVMALFGDMQAKGAIVRHGDDYADHWYKLRPPYKKKYLDELRSKNSATKLVGTLGEEALRRALNKIVAEDGLRSMEERWAEAARIEAADGDAKEQSEGGTGQDTPIPSSPNPEFFRSEARKEKFGVLAGNTLQDVEKSGFSNSEKSQARGYLIAAKALSEVPDPPVDLIWTILNRANSVAGIGSFFLAMIMLIATVAI